MTAGGSLIGPGRQLKVPGGQSGPWRPPAPPPGQTAECRPSAGDSGAHRDPGLTLQHVSTECRVSVGLDLFIYILTAEAVELERI